MREKKIAKIFWGTNHVLRDNYQLMGEAGEAAFETAVELAQSDAGVGVLTAICTAFLCCIKPVKNRWKSLSQKSKVNHIRQ